MKALVRVINPPRHSSNQKLNVYARFTLR